MLFQTFPIYLAGWFIAFQSLHKGQILHCFSSLLPIFISSQGQGEFANCFLFQCVLRGTTSLQPWKALRYILLWLLTFLLWKVFSNFLSFIPKNIELFTEIWVFPYRKKRLPSWTEAGENNFTQTHYSLDRELHEVLRSCLICCLLDIFTFWQGPAHLATLDSFPLK